MEDFERKLDMSLEDLMKLAKKRVPDARDGTQRKKADGNGATAMDVALGAKRKSRGAKPAAGLKVAKAGVAKKSGVVLAGGSRRGGRGGVVVGGGRGTLAGRGIKAGKGAPKKVAADGKSLPGSRGHLGATKHAPKQIPAHLMPKPKNAKKGNAVSGVRGGMQQRPQDDIPLNPVSHRDAKRAMKVAQEMMRKAQSILGVKGVRGANALRRQQPAPQPQPTIKYVPVPVPYAHGALHAALPQAYDSPYQAQQAHAQATRKVVPRTQVNDLPPSEPRGPSYLHDTRYDDVVERPVHHARAHQRAQAVEVYDDQNGGDYDDDMEDVKPVMLQGRGVRVFPPSQNRRLAR